MRKKIVVCLAVFVLVLAGALLWLPTDAPRMTVDQVEKIQIGMSMDEVEAILGCPPGNYSYWDHSVPRFFYHRTGELELGRPYREWTADSPVPRNGEGAGTASQKGVTVRVWFDEQGKVICKTWMGYSYTPRPSIWDRLRGFVKW